MGVQQHSISNANGTTNSTGVTLAIPAAYNQVVIKAENDDLFFWFTATLAEVIVGAGITGKSPKVLAGEVTEPIATQGAGSLSIKAASGTVTYTVNYVNER